MPAGFENRVLAALAAYRRSAEGDFAVLVLLRRMAWVSAGITLVAVCLNWTDLFDPGEVVDLASHSALAAFPE